MTTPDPDEIPLPGMDSVAGRPLTPLESAVRRSIEAHRNLQHLSEADAGKCAIAIELCQVAAAKRAGGRMSTVGNDLRLLSEILDSLTPTTDSDVDARLAAAMAEWSEEVNASEQLGDSGSEVRNEA